MLAGLFVQSIQEVPKPWGVIKEYIDEKEGSQREEKNGEIHHKNS
jgi:hypothetical protein